MPGRPGIPSRSSTFRRLLRLRAASSPSGSTGRTPADHTTVRVAISSPPRSTTRSELAVSTNVEVLISTPHRLRERLHAEREPRQRLVREVGVHAAGREHQAVVQELVACSGANDAPVEVDAGDGRLPEANVPRAPENRAERVRDVRRV